MLCRKHLKKVDEDSVDEDYEPVYLNVYDMSSYNGYAYRVGLGIYHSGVQVYGMEYGYGAHENPESGIFEMEPREYDGYTFRKSILIGKTDIGPDEVEDMMDELGKVYKGNEYNLFTKNCNHFCRDACKRLTGRSIPKWVNRLAKIGYRLKFVLPESLKTCKIPPPIIEDEPEPEIISNMPLDLEKIRLANCALQSIPYPSSGDSPRPPLNV